MTRLIHPGLAVLALALIGCDQRAERQPEATTRDDEPPAWHSGDRVWITGTGRLFASIAWSPAVDNIGPVVYEVAWGQRRMTTHGTQMRLTGLSPEVPTRVEVHASDASGNHAASVLTISVSIDGGCTTPLVAMPATIGGP
jgi:hypothetical protein